jgi:tetratricopeptide (TPR) repeat protein
VDGRAASDVALLELPNSVTSSEPALLGRLPADDGGAKLQFDLYGWPEWGLTHVKYAGPLAGGRHVDGTIYLADVSPEGLLVLEATRRPDAVSAVRESQWGGISGAAVICDGLIVAVQRQHQNPARQGSLEAVELAKFAEDPELLRILAAAAIDVSWPTAEVGGGLAEIFRFAVKRRASPGMFPEVVAEADKEHALSPAWVTATSDSRRVFGVPLYPSDHFTGRRADLAALTESLARVQAPQFAVIAGDAGVGKTQLAVEYAYAERDRNDVTWWLRADRAETLLSDFAGLAAEEPLASECLVSSDRTVEQQAAAVRTWLERHGGWLLVFDNVSEFGQLRDLLPRGGDGKIIVTSRRDDGWTAIARVLRLEVLDPGSASGLLRSRSGDDDEAAAQALAVQLGGLPLALEQAAAYISQTAGFGLADFLERFSTQRKDLLERGQAYGYEGTINSTWSLSLKQLREKTPDAVELLNLFAFLDPDDIPVKLIREQMEALSDEDDSFDALGYADAIGALRAYGLAKSAGDGLYVHRLLQTVVRNGLSDEEAADAARGALACVTVCLAEVTDSQHMSLPIGQRLLPHALAVRAHAERMEIEPQTLSVLLTGVGLHLVQLGEYSQAIPVLADGLATDEALFGPDSAELIGALTALGTAYREAGQLAQARAQLDRAVAIGERTLSPDDPDLVWIYVALGTTLTAQADLSAARVALERALALGEPALGADHVDLVDIHVQLGVVLRDQGERERARVELERAAAASDERGVDPGVFVRAHGALGILLAHLFDFPRAREELQRAIAAGEELWGVDHPGLVPYSLMIGIVLRGEGRLVEARDQLNHAIALVCRKLGTDHPLLVEARCSLGWVLVELGEPAAAQAELECAIAIGERALGRDHTHLVSAHANLGWALKQQGEFEAARTALEHAIELGGQKLGPRHVSLVAPHVTLGQTLHWLGELSAARETLEFAVELAEAVLAEPHPFRVNARLSLGVVLHDLGEHASAAAELERTLAEQEALFGPDDPRLTDTLRALGKAERRLGWLSDAIDHLKRAAALEDGTVTPAPRNCWETLLELGTAERLAGDSGAAREHIRLALARGSAAFAAGDVMIGYTHFGLGLCERGLGDLTAARAHFEDALRIEGAAIGPDSVEVGQCHYQLGLVALDAGNNIVAKTHLDGAVRILSTQLGDIDGQVATALIDLARAASALSDFATAKASLEWAFAASRVRDRKEEPAKALLGKLGPVLAALGHPRPALTVPAHASICIEDAIAAQRRWLFDLRGRALAGSDMHALLEPALDDVLGDPSRVEETRCRWAVLEEEHGAGLLRGLENYVLMTVIDDTWPGHCEALHERLTEATAIDDERARALVLHKLDTELADGVWRRFLVSLFTTEVTFASGEQPNGEELAKRSAVRQYPTSTWAARGQYNVTWRR